MTLREEMKKLHVYTYDINKKGSRVFLIGEKELETLVNDQITSFAERVKKRGFIDNSYNPNQKIIWEHDLNQELEALRGSSDE